MWDKGGNAMWRYLFFICNLNRRRTMFVRQKATQFCSAVCDDDGVFLFVHEKYSRNDDDYVDDC